MPDSHTELYTHMTWATRGRQPLLVESVRERVYRCCLAECCGLGAQGISIGGTDDHVHMLVRLPATTDVARLVKQLKGVSSHAIRAEGIHDGFGWQEGYSAFSVSRWDVPKMTAYIRGQEEHHRTGTAKPALELP